MLKINLNHNNTYILNSNHSKINKNGIEFYILIIDLKIWKINKNYFKCNFHINNNKLKLNKTKNIKLMLVNWFPNYLIISNKLKTNKKLLCKSCINQLKRYLYLN